MCQRRGDVWRQLVRNDDFNEMGCVHDGIINSKGLSGNGTNNLDTRLEPRYFVIEYFDIEIKLEWS